MKPLLKKGKWLIIVVVIVFAVIGVFFIGKTIYIKSADTSWIVELGYNETEIRELKLDKSSCPRIPIEFNGKSYYFDFDTGCSNNIVLTNELENKVDYTVTEEIEQLNRDGSHRGWSYGITVDELKLFDALYKNVNCTMIDWKMSSSEKFNGLVGTKMFENKTVTLDYRARLMGVSENAPDYSKLEKEKYAIVPIIRTDTEGQENLVFFECVLNGERRIAYIDTGKNISYIHNSGSGYMIGGTDRPDSIRSDALIEIGGLSLELKGLYEANITQYDDFDSILAVELNSDQILKNELVICFDFVNNDLIFYKRGGSIF